jgi:putative DNA primase/helicase
VFTAVYISRFPRLLQPLWEVNNDLVRKYLHAVGSTGWDATQERIAARFALVYAAGSLASRFGILPWKWEPRLLAVKTCHQRIIFPIEARAATTPADTIPAVRTYITENLDRFIGLTSRSISFTKQDLDAAYGISHLGKKGKPEYLLANRRFRNAVCGGRPAERVIEDLRAAELINVQQGGKWTVTRDFPNPLGHSRAISIKREILERV